MEFHPLSLKEYVISLPNCYNHSLRATCLARAAPPQFNRQGASETTAPASSVSSSFIFEAPQIPHLSFFHASPIRGIVAARSRHFYSFKRGRGSSAKWALIVESWALHWTTRGCAAFFFGSLLWAFRRSRCSFRLPCCGLQCSLHLPPLPSISI